MLIPFGEYDSIFFILVLAVFALSMVAQGRVARVFARYAKQPAAGGKSGGQVAKEILARSGSAVQVQGVHGHLTDHYNPRTHIVGLSQEVFNSASVSAVAIAAHEVGHVLQYEEDYLPIKIRGTLLPVAQVGSQAGPFLVLFGLILGWSPVFALIGVALYTFAVLFQLFTLPVELNASRRALELLVDGGYITPEQSPEAKKMLSAAATTYILAAVASFVTLLRLLMLSRRRR